MSRSFDHFDHPCGWVTERLELYLDGELHGPERLQLESHLRECAQCAAYLGEDQKAVDALLVALAPEVEPDSARSLPSPGMHWSSHTKTRRSRWRRPAAVLVAAAVLCGLVFWGRGLIHSDHIPLDSKDSAALAESLPDAAATRPTVAGSDASRAPMLEMTPLVRVRPSPPRADLVPYMGCRDDGDEADPTRGATAETALLVGKRRGRARTREPSEVVALVDDVLAMRRRRDCAGEPKLLAALEQVGVLSLEVIDRRLVGACRANRKLRGELVELLGSLRVEGREELLFDVVRNDPKSCVRLRALRVLDRLLGEEGAPEFLELARSQDSALLRIRCAAAAARRGSTEGLRELRDVFVDPKLRPFRLEVMREVSHLDPDLAGVLGFCRCVLRNWRPAVDDEGILRLAVDTLIRGHDATVRSLLQRLIHRGDVTSSLQAWMNEAVERFDGRRP
ncbi:MAG TPA: hypothetical protein ENK43_13050 [Planctomycetes bacterium]|nr:hypothetical protein [Planctomycetota bacterium]